MDTCFVSVALSDTLRPGRPPPWICAIAAVVVDVSSNEISSFHEYIRPAGRTVDPRSSAAHGVTQAIAEQHGVDELFALGSVFGLKAGAKRGVDEPGLVNAAARLVIWDADQLEKVLKPLWSRHGEYRRVWQVGASAISLREEAQSACRIPDPSPKGTGAYKIPNRDDAAGVLLCAPKRMKPLTPASNLQVERAIFEVLRKRGSIHTSEELF